MRPDSPSASGFSLARLDLRGDQELVSLTRHTRRAGEEFGLAARDVRTFTAATFEIGRILAGRPGLEAEVRLDEGPSIQVVFRMPAGPGAEGEALRHAIAAGTEAIHGMVHEIAVDERDGRVAVCLRMLFPTDAAHAAPVSHPSKNAVHAGTEGLSLEELRREHAKLEDGFQELHAELEETNRGVVALHAELEAQAEQLRQAEDRLRLLLDSVHDYAICMLTPEGEVASWNAGAERLFGYTADEIVGRHFGCFYERDDGDHGAPASDLVATRELGRIAGECVRVRQNGTRFDAHVVITAVRREVEGDISGYALVVRDITERRRLERDLRRRADELAAANRAKEDFLATLSHELRTPLNAMLGWTRLLRLGKLDDAGIARALQTIERNAHIQEQLISDILDVSRIVTGKLRLDLRPIELAPVVEAAVDAVRPTAGVKNLQLECRLAFRELVLGDPDRLQQVVWNLLVNAVKFTPAGGRIDVELTRVGANAVITVTDNGEGIASDLLPYVFDRFRQGDASVTRPHGGLGLGLSIVRHLVELHGGRVQAQSEGKGKGATFRVHLPVRSARQGPQLVERQAM